MGGPAFTRANGYASTCEVSLDLLLEHHQWNVENAALVSQGAIIRS